MNEFLSTRLHIISSLLNLVLNSDMKSQTHHNPNIVISPLPLALKSHFLNSNHKQPASTLSTAKGLKSPDRELSFSKSFALGVLRNIRNFALIKSLTKSQMILASKRIN